MHQTLLTKDPSGKKMTITRSFDAPPVQVWQAWTDPALLDQWWAPQPWRAETKFMDFRPGGYWLYCMIGPEGERSWARADYLEVDAPRRITSKDSFTNENGDRDHEFPSMNWITTFRASEEGTEVTVEITCNEAADLEKILELGFEEGFSSAHNNLDQ
ncbi:MAG TPA: SRPBCC domain-containing protein, partial [Chitinophagaceae bacterium]|nr:SRPBCC domain-containing protein [Chitinophagaceae bacterium]